MNGLTSKEAVQRLNKFGLNLVKEKPQHSVINLFFSQFKSPLVYVLLVSGLVTFVLTDYIDMVVILAAALINSSLGFYQEQKAQKAVLALRKLLAQQAKVIREGKKQVILAQEVVPGDLVLLTIGDRAPADGYLVEAADLTVEEAILTGESVPVTKLKGDPVFSGTTVATGIGRMIASKTGAATEIGKIGQVAGEIKEEKTPLQIQLAKLARTLAFTVLGISVSIFIFGSLRGYGLTVMFTTSVAVAVAAIPEGLVVTLTVILALGIQRLSKRKVIVKKLLAAETLGSVSTLCVDKTGTLTEGKMRVVKADFIDKDLGLKATVLCNDLRDPLETAMMKWGEQKLGRQGVERLNRDYLRIEEIPFSLQTKLIAILYQFPVSESKNQRLLLVSGAPEIVLQHSNLNLKERQAWLKRLSDFGKQGFRVVGFAHQKLKGLPVKIENSYLNNLSWLGLLIYEDPVRQGIKESLEACDRAGIKVKVITGDYLPTALAVLKKLGLDGREHSLTGDELEKMSKEELKNKVGEVVLFARTNPGQKLKIIQALKENGETVAMMGDGVNDAPALKQADIGIVVGEASDVAKETADMILLDTNFATIAKAVEGGRTIFENIKKVTLLLLSGGFMEVVLVGGALLLGWPMPVTAAQILWLNLMEDTFPAIALAYEEEESDVMNEPPRPRAGPILDAKLKGLIIIFAVVSNLILFLLYYRLNQQSLPLEHLQTLMFVALGINSIFIAFACRSFRQTVFQKGLLSNRALVRALGLALLMLLAVVYFPPLRIFFQTEALSSTEWLFLIVLGMLNLVIIEGIKVVFLRYGKMKKR